MVLRDGRVRDDTDGEARESLVSFRPTRSRRRDAVSQDHSGHTVSRPVGRRAGRLGRPPGTLGAVFGRRSPRRDRGECKPNAVRFVCDIMVVIFTAVLGLRDRL